MKTCIIVLAGIILTTLFGVIPIRLTEKLKMRGIYDYRRLVLIMVYVLVVVILIAVIIIILKALGLLNL